MTYCAGPCNNKWRKAELAHEANPAVRNTITPRDGNPVWCADRLNKDGVDISCTALVRRALRGFEQIYDLLEDSKAESTPDKGDRRGFGEPPSAGPEFDSQDELARVLRDWEKDVRDARGLHDVGDLRTSDDYQQEIAGSINFLTIHLDWALSNPDTVNDQLGYEILAEHRRLQGLTKSSDRPEHQPVPCEACTLHTMFYAPGDLYVRCKNDDCGALVLYGPEWDAVKARRAKLIATVTRRKAG